MRKLGDTSSLNRYFGQPIGNGQDPDEPGDRSASRYAGSKISGKGAQGGGSKPAPQTRRMTTGSGTRSARVSVPSSHPKQSQRIRG